MYSPTLYLPTFLPKQKASALLHSHILKHYYNLVFLSLKAEFHFNMSTSPAYTLEFESSQCNIAQNIFFKSAQNSYCNDTLFSVPSKKGTIVLCSREQSSSLILNVT